MEASLNLKEQARSLGFSLVGVCPADTPSHLEFYKRWLEKGYHGEMSYLADQLPLRNHPQQLLPGALSIVAVGMNYYQEPSREEGYPVIARYALGRDYHKVLRSKLKKLARFIEASYPEAASRVCVDSAPIFERDYAQQAGLGWYGKNTCLINTRQGSWFVIGLLLTTVAFEPDRPAVGQCGTCRACVDACPNGAIVFEEERWQVDARRCVSYLTIEKGRTTTSEGRGARGEGREGENGTREDGNETLSTGNEESGSEAETTHALPNKSVDERESTEYADDSVEIRFLTSSSRPASRVPRPEDSPLHSEDDDPSAPSSLSWTFGCDICQEVCPFNRKAIITTEPDFLATREWPNLKKLAKITYEDWDALTKGSPLRRVGYEGLKQNAKRCSIG
jgi:epoxyqueuosine reductase